MTAALLEELKKLDRDERLQLVGDLWDSIAAEQDAPPLSEAKIRELWRRWDAYLANPDSASEWSEVRRRICQSDG